MLLAIDIGNTNVVVALFAANDDVTQTAAVLHEWRISTDARRTGDEYASFLAMMFRSAGVDTARIANVVVSSVVPALVGTFVTVARGITGKKPLLVGKDLYPLLPVTFPPPAEHELGADLLCNAVEAWCRYRKAVIVVDFGTALTFTTIDQFGAVQGVAIAPGLGTAIRSLSANTAQLPLVELKAPPTSLGANTVECIQAGVILGYKGLVEYMIARTKADLCARTGVAAADIHVVATGGLNSVLQPIVDCFEDFDRELTLQGLRRVALFAAQGNVRA